MEKPKKFNAKYYLTDEETISYYLKHALKEEDEKYLIKVRENIQKAREAKIQVKKNRNRFLIF